MDAPATAGTRQDEAADAWMRMGFLLLEAATKNAIHCGQEDRDALLRRVEETAAGLQETPSSSQVLMGAGSLSQALDRYNLQTQQRFEKADGDLRALVRRLITHVESVHAHSPNVARLAGLRSALDSITPGEFSAFQEKLAAALQVLGSEHAEGLKQSDQLQETLRDRITVLEQTGSSRSPAQQMDRPVTTLDPCTGLPVRVEAEIAIQKAMTASSRIFVAAFYVHRMNLTNARFGEAIGNQVILFCSQQIATHLTKGTDQLFRWMGPAFVAILERKESELNVASEVQRVVSAPLSRFFETSSRTVYLPMKMSGEPIPTAGRTYAEVMDHLEKFFLKASHQRD